MKKLTVSDIRGPKLYEGFRDDLRKRIIELKRRRRFGLGPTVTLLFENRATVLFQIEEMCRAESITDPAKIAEEVEVYNKLLPEDGQLAATLFIELTEQASLETTLNSLVGLQEHVWLDVGEHPVRAAFDPEQFQTDKLAAVQYLHFPLDEAARAALARPGTRLRLRSDHPSYRYELELDEPARVELAGDVIGASGG